MKSIRELLAAVAAGLALAVSPGVDAASAPPAAVFFNAPDMSEPVLSPQGDAIALLVKNAQGRRQLAILQTTNLSRISVAASFADADVRSVQWVDDTRLIFKLSTGADTDSGARGSGLMAVDRDGSNMRLLIMRSDNTLLAVSPNIIGRPLSGDHRLLRTLSDNSGDVIIERPSHTGLTSGSDWEMSGTTPLRLNTRNGHVSEIAGAKPAGHVVQWAIDDKGLAQWAVSRQDDVATFFESDVAGAWKERGHLRAERRSPAEGDFVRAAVDGHTYLAHTASVADRTLALFRVDATTGGLEHEPVVALKGFDFEGSLVEDTGNRKILGIRYEADAAGTVWFDPALKALQARIDGALPGRVNIIEPAPCGCSKTALLTSWSSRQPSQFFLIDTVDGTLTPVGSSRAGIVAPEMAATDFVRAKTRDGHDLPLYVTKPAGKGPWPAVVLIHGGAWERGWSWRWDSLSQFLASRGYLVVKPETRGSRGYGQDWFEAGFGEWGGKIQNDVEDAARWAATQGLADPARICLAGTDFGGYSTLVGLARSPDLFRCGVAWSPISDIEQVLSTTWVEASERQRPYGLAALMGDIAKTPEQLARASPVAQAARITRPLLLADGFEDDHRTLAATRAIRTALQSRHVPVTLLAYPDEAHEFGKPATRIAFYEQMESFLATNLAVAPAALATTAGQ